MMFLGFKLWFFYFFIFCPAIFCIVNHFQTKLSSVYMHNLQDAYK